MKIHDNFGDLTEKRQIKRMKMEYQYTWVIQNFRNCYASCGHHDESSTFSMGQNNEYEWVLKIYPDGYSASGFIDIYPSLINEALHDNIKFFVEISLMNKDGREQRTGRLILTLENLNGKGGNFKYCIARGDLVKDPNLLPNGELRISCRFSFDAPSTAEETIEIQYFQLYKKSQLDSFEQLYGNEEFSDFKLVFGNREFPVHQAILATRSSVFKAMFLSNMRESREKKVYIEDVDPEIMMKVLRYIYVGKVGKIQDVADKVLAVADKYQLDALKQMCEDILTDQLSIDNVYKFLELADNYNAENLKIRGLEYFKKNSEILAAADDFRYTISSLPANLQIDIICAQAMKN